MARRRGNAERVDDAKVGRKEGRMTCREQQRRAGEHRASEATFWCVDL
jgi:hypothetical protein